MTEPLSSVRPSKAPCRVRRRPLALLLALLMAVAPACYSWRVVRVAPAEVEDITAERIVGVTTVDGVQVRFDPLGGWIRGQVLTGTVFGLSREYPLADVQLYWLEREELDVWRSLGAAVVAGGVVALMVFGIVEVSDAESVSEIF